MRATIKTGFVAAAFAALGAASALAPALIILGNGTAQAGSARIAFGGGDVAAPRQGYIAAVGSLISGSVLRNLDDVERERFQGVGVVGSPNSVNGKYVSGTGSKVSESVVLIPLHILFDKKTGSLKGRAPFYFFAKNLDPQMRCELDLSERYLRKFSPVEVLENGNLNIEDYRPGKDYIPVILKRDEACLKIPSVELKIPDIDERFFNSPPEMQFSNSLVLVSGPNNSKNYGIDRMAISDNCGLVTTTPERINYYSAGASQAVDHSCSSLPGSSGGMLSDSGGNMIAMHTGAASDLGNTDPSVDMPYEIGVNANRAVLIDSEIQRLVDEAEREAQGMPMSMSTSEN